MSRCNFILMCQSAELVELKEKKKKLENEDKTRLYKEKDEANVVQMKMKDEQATAEKAALLAKIQVLEEAKVEAERKAEESALETERAKENLEAYRAWARQEVEQATSMSTAYQYACDVLSKQHAEPVQSIAPTQSQPAERQTLASAPAPVPSDVSYTPVRGTDSVSAPARGARQPGTTSTRMASRTFAPSPDRKATALVSTKMSEAMSQSVLSGLIAAAIGVMVPVISGDALELQVARDVRGGAAVEDLRKEFEAIYNPQPAATNTLSSSTR